MEILNYRDVVDKPNVIGEFDVYLPGMQLTLFRMKVVRTKTGKTFSNAPSYMVEVAGAKKFYPYYSFSEEKQREFNEKIMELLKPFLERSKEPPF